MRMSVGFVETHCVESFRRNKMKMYFMFVAVCFLGCASSPPPVPSAVPVEVPDTLTAGEYCDITGSTACSKLFACDLVPSDTSMADCISKYKSGCCAKDGLCDKPIGTTAEKTKHCCNEVNNMSCESFSLFAKGDSSLMPKDCK
jgi:hypothetical protein